MKKAHLIFLPIFFTLIFFVPNAFAQNSDPSPYKEFVAASLHDKAVILENAPENTSQKFYEMSLSFVYDNKVLIEDLPDYYILLLATIGKLDANGSDGIDDVVREEVFLAQIAVAGIRHGLCPVDELKVFGEHLPVERILLGRMAQDTSV